MRPQHGLARTWLVVFSLGVLSVASSSSRAQERLVVADQSACASCSITVRERTILGDERGRGTIDHSESRALRRRDGTFLVRGNYSTELKVFGADGKFVRTIGREGGGPGEFRGIATLAPLRGDSVLVLDWGASAYSVLAPNDSVVRGGALPFVPGNVAVALPSGELLINKDVRTAASIGYPLHRVARDGRLMQSFGSDAGVFRPDIPYLVSRALASSRGALVWSALRTNYQIDLVDARRGTTLRSLRRDATWFPDGMLPPKAGKTESLAPTPFIQDIREDSAGRLWVLISVADPNWRQAVRPPQGAGDHPVILDEHGYRDTRIEVLDPARGVLLASTRVPNVLTHFVADGVIGAVLLDASDVPRLFTWTVEFTQTSRRAP